MAIFSSIAAGLAAAGAWLASGTLAATVATNLLVTGVGMAVSKVMGANAPSGGSQTAADPGVRIQLAPNTANKVPVQYGRAITGGIMTHANISVDNDQMTYVLVLSEETGNTTFTVNEVYRNDETMDFTPGNASIDSFTDADGNTNANVAGQMSVQVYVGDSTDSASQIFPTTNKVAANTVATVLANDSANMTGLVYAVVTMEYFPAEGLTGLGTINFDLESDLYTPSNVLLDYLTNDRYGAGLTSDDLDLASFADMAAYCQDQVDYTPYDSATTTQDRWRIDGILSTYQAATTNINKICQTASTWFTYNPKAGKFSVVPNRQWTAPEQANAWVFSDDNIISSIDVSTTELYSLYNVMEVEHPQFTMKDQTEVTYVEIAPAARNPNEPENKLVTRFDLVNDNSRAENLANIDLKQSRFSTVLSFTADYSAIQVDVGDVVKVNNDIYGYTDELFRVIRVDEQEGDSGELTTKISLLEYADAVYDHTIVLQKAPVNPNGVPGFQNNANVIQARNENTADHALDGFGNAVITGFFIDVPDLINQAEFVAIEADIANNAANIVTISNDVANITVDLGTLETDLLNTNTNVAINSIAITDLETTTIPGLESDITNLEANLSTNSNAITLLNTTTIPNLESNLSTNTNAISVLNVTTIPALDSDLANVEAEVANIELDLANAATYPITTTDISNDAITTPLLATNSVTALKIAAGTITASEIAAGTITAANMLAGTITANEIAAGTITTNEIAAGTITASDIQSGTITATQIAASTITGNEIAAGTITASDIQAGTITATEIATGSITALQIAASTITGAEIAAGTITASDIQAGTITTNEIAAGTIKASDIQAGTITTNEIAALTILAGDIGANQITVGKIATNAVTAGTIAAGAVTTTTMTANAINANRLTTGTLDCDKIQSGTAAEDAGLIFGFGAGSSLNGIFASGIFVSTQTATSGVIGATTTETGGLFGSAGDLHACAGYSGADSGFTAASWDYAGVLGYGTTAAAYFTNYAGTITTTLVDSTWGVNTDGDVTANSYTPFTGAHEALMHKSHHPDVGDIMVDVDVIERISVSDTVTSITPSSVANQAGAIGVYVRKIATDYVPKSMSNATMARKAKGSNAPKKVRTLKTEHVSVMESHDAVFVNSVGEGQINVIGENGNISIGDLIVTSNTDGKGMKQSDDIVRSITVAKSRENVTFASPSEEKMIACIYLSG